MNYQLAPSEKTEVVATQIVDAALEVHRALGPGYLESVYEAAFTYELTLRSIFFERQCVVPIFYKERLVGESRLDLIVGKLVVVELKAVPAMLPIHTAQVLSYLKATSIELGFILNFGAAHMKDGARRLVRTHTP